MPLELLRCGADVAAVNFDFCAQRLKTFQVQVDGPGADDAAAGQRHARLFQPAQQRPHDANRAAHFADEFVIGVTVDFLRADGQRAALELHRGAERFENPRHEPRVAQIRHARG